MNAIEKLTEVFREFPGIGPRQAKRFVYYLLLKQPAYLDTLSRLIKEIRNEVHSCTSCFRLFGSTSSPSKSLCSVCADNSRDNSLLMVLEKDIDLESIERSRAYTGRYFVLGGTVAILEKEPEKTVRVRELLSHIEKNKGTIREIILAFSVNADGENTAEYVTTFLKPTIEKNGMKISGLGRGLSTGSEVEYADTETLKSALKNRI